ncbi:lysozyme inhibitor LprI family protein [Sphingomicrobium arenosum]|uniref:lysozyme inhibitor LprI family protein n=1 Tax=Sphingomicrobium arenosum TaxID=2233861 RepID=UPI002240F20C|nr:lysozyme inhibitor LprI family protein [Sphingomicrobium arenosum]
MNVVLLSLALQVVVPDVPTCSAEDRITHCGRRIEQPSEQPPEVGDCFAADFATQAELNRCAAEAFAEADATLNALWQAQSPETRAALLPSQRAWLAYRDAQCDLEASLWMGGSALPLILDSCRNGLTRRRIEELEGVLYQMSL